MKNNNNFAGAALITIAAVFLIAVFKVGKFLNIDTNTSSSVVIALSATIAFTSISYFVANYLFSAFWPIALASFWASFWPAFNYWSAHSDIVPWFATPLVQWGVFILIVIIGYVTKFKIES